jgi:hypothetical protein
MFVGMTGKRAADVLHRPPRIPFDAESAKNLELPAGDDFVDVVPIWSRHRNSRIGK